MTHSRRTSVTSTASNRPESSDPKDSKDIHPKKQKWWYKIIHPKHLHDIAKYCPLVAAIAAPVATLLDIPALSEHWYNQYGTPQPDPTACLILSAIGLALNIIANALLVIRFSGKSEKWWKGGTRLSLVFWVGKTIVALVNLIIFGIFTRNSDGYTYAEGFWSAVVSVIDSGVISIALLIHYFLAFGREDADAYDIRSDGRRFMLSVTFLIGILALQSLVFCKIESWSYSDALYFSVQVALTIGYGDFAPTSTATKILIFPFAVLTISQLGNQIAMVVSYFSARAEARRSRWRVRYEGAMHREANKLRPHASLTEEMALIYQINQREEMMSQLYDLLWSAFGLISFWVVGAGIFSSIEGWTYGNGIYSVMIMSLTIGFGDFPMTQPASRVVFVVYALMAVPIVTSFAVQTITGLLSTYTERGATRTAFVREKTNTPDAFDSHANFVLKFHNAYSEMREKLTGENFGQALEKRRPEEGEERGANTEAEGYDDEGDDGHREDDELSMDMDTTHTKPSQSKHSKEQPGKQSIGDGKDDSGDVEGSSEWDSEATIATGNEGGNVHHEDGFRDSQEMKKEAEEVEAEDTIRDESASENEEKHFRDEGKIIRKDVGKVGKLVNGKRRLVKTRGSDSRRSDGGDQEKEDDGEGKDYDKNHGGVDEQFENQHEEKEGEGEHLVESDATRKLELDLLKQLMNRMVQLEAEARQMLLDSMDKGIARTLLLADRNVQIRDVRALRGDDANMLAIWRGEEEKTKKDVKKREATQPEELKGGEADMLSRVRRYRNTFAEILVLGSILQKLEGEELNRFERFRTNENVEEKKEDEGIAVNEGLDKVADQRFNGLTGRMFRHHARRLREGELSLV